MAVISDSPPLETNFNEWVKTMKKDDVPMPSRKDILEKQEAIQKAVIFVYSSETVKQILQEKKSASARPLNVAAEKDHLRKEKEVAESKQNRAEVERIQARLQELEALSRQVKVKDAKAVKLAEMNKKNRAENFKNAPELKPVNQGLKAGEAGGYEAVAALDGGVGAMSFGLDGHNGVAAGLEAGKLVDTNAPVDQGTESNSFH